MTELHVKDFVDLGYTVVAIPDSHHVDYKVYEIAGLDGATGKTIWLHAGGTWSTDVVDTLADARIFAEGHVKWDGCSNWTIHNTDVMLHGCDRQDLLNIGLVLAACWDWTAELCPHWSR